ncbi:MAG TPA: tripeptide aminopeptidase PepT, partial [Spirochaetia bacterium]|nr:tripeptide aminopeptidase PepT [Spirochaetia bacterium]
HGPLELIFTPDEETGRGLDFFPVEKLASRCCYTMDGGEEGVIETECFNAYHVRAVFSGRVIHLGTARGRLVNAVTMAGAFLDMLPASESPEATDGRYGYYCPLEIKGNLERAELDVFIRDFEEAGITRRLETLRSIARAVETIYQPGKCELTETRQYLNMNTFVQKDPLVSDLLIEAVRLSGVEPVVKVIRGGTDGAHLSEKGIPTPNVFTGGHNYHSRLEWASRSTMERATETILSLISLWAAER